MKKIILSAVASSLLFCFAGNCHANETDDDGQLIADLKCDSAVLKFNSGRVPAMEDFLTAVNNKWHFDALTSYLTEKKGKLGSLTYATSDDLENDELNYYFSSKILKRSDGSYLYAYIHGHSEGTGNSLCFFTYNSETSEFTPYKSPVDKISADYKYTDNAASFNEDSDSLSTYMIFLYNESDEPSMSIEHVYSWDGSSYKLEGANLWTDGKIKTDYDPEMKNRSKMALLDVDGDNIPELWISTEEGNCQEMFSLNDGIKLIADSSFGPPSFTFTENGVMVSDPDGFNLKYTSIRNSNPKDVYRADCKIEGEKEICSYFINGKKISKKEWSSKASFLNSTREIKPVFEKLLSIN